MPRKGFTSSPLGTVVVLVVTTAVILGGLWFVKGGGSDDGVTQVTLTGDVAAAPPKVGETAADFAAVDIIDTPVSLADLRGQPVWLVFGATWCADCRSEAADIEAVQQALGDQAAIVGIYIEEDQATVQDYAQRLGLTYTQVPDPATTLGSAYRVMGIPTHYFIAADGTIAKIRVGALSTSTAKAALSELIE